MRRDLALGLVAAAVMAAPAHAAPVLHVGPDGAVVRNDPYLPPPAAADLAPPPAAAGAPARARTAARTTVRQAIAEAFETGEITEDERDEWRAAYTDALRTRARLTGARRVQLDSVIETLEDIAGADQLTGSRMPALFLQLARNTEFWPNRPYPSTANRVRFEGSEVTFQHYPGFGLQIQPLANFGTANALWRDGKVNRLRTLLDELVEIASRRGRFTTWEYWFRFGGGTPPWTSAMSQGTAIQALSRASELLEEPSYLAIARSGIRAFSTRYPVGVRAPGRDGGNHYLIYSFSPGLRVLNAFTQTLNGLYDYGAISGHARALELFERGERSLRAELLDYDTGAWTRYSLGGAEATLEYHQLASDFIANLCDRIGTPFWCDAAVRLEGYVTESPRLELVTARLVEEDRQFVRFTLSKRSTVRITISRSGRVVYSAAADTPFGTRSFAWTPRRAGDYVVTLSAASFGGTQGSTSGTIEVRPKS
jgi:hypothetical protein